jgi:proteasome lid subunit RPN8/RPN11
VKEFIEECWFLYGVKTKNYFIGFLVYHSAGSSGGVEFDWKKAMHPVLLGWYHTHPYGFGANPSETDKSTMSGWVRGRGQPLLCGIGCEGKKNWFKFFRDSEGNISRQLLEVDNNFPFVWGKF